MTFAIQTTALTRRFAGGHGITDVALAVPTGSIYGFLGPNGAGKTTTIRLLLDLIVPDRGEILLMGQPLRRDRRAALADVGALVESPSLYPHLSGWENLEIARRLLALPFLLAACSAPQPHAPLPPVHDPVGRHADGRQVTPVNQTLTPHGTFVELKGLRPQVIAQSRDGQRLYVAGKTHELLVLDAETGAIVQNVPLPDEKQTALPTDPDSRDLLPDKDGQVSYTGLAVSPDGASIYLSNVRGSIKVFAVGADGAVQPSHTLPLPPANAPRREAEIPSGLALSQDGSKLYVCGNLSNQLLELDARTGKVLRTFPVGTAPFDVVLW